MRSPSSNAAYSVVSESNGRNTGIPPIGIEFAEREFHIQGLPTIRPRDSISKHCAVYRGVTAAKGIIKTKFAARIRSASRELPWQLLLRWGIKRVHKQTRPRTRRRGWSRRLSRQRWEWRRD